MEVKRAFRDRNDNIRSSETGVMRLNFNNIQVLKP